MSQAIRVSETLILSEHYIAEDVGTFWRQQWSIWELSQASDPKDDQVPIFDAQNGADAALMIDAFERIRFPPAAHPSTHAGAPEAK